MYGWAWILRQGEGLVADHVADRVADHVADQAAHHVGH
jgi:hypothetical protein